jgi:hypothetical protein
MNLDKPLGALARFVLWQIVSRLRAEIEFEWIEGAKLIVSRGMTGATGNIYCGLHEFVEMGFVLHLLRPNDLFLDVGANMGASPYSPREFARRVRLPLSRIRLQPGYCAGILP